MCRLEMKPNISEFPTFHHTALLSYPSHPQFPLLYALLIIIVKSYRAFTMKVVKFVSDLPNSCIPEPVTFNLQLNP